MLFLAFDATFKLVVSPEAVAGTMELGWAEHHLRMLAVILPEGDGAWSFLLKGAPDKVAAVWAHLGRPPLLVGADRAKLSKRHGAISLEDFRDRGYLPEALCNYLGLLGFSLPPDESGASREIASLDELGVLH